MATANPYALTEIEAAGAAPANENPFTLHAIEQDQASALRASLRSAAAGNPDQAAKANNLARVSGVPAEVAERNLPELEAAYQMQAYERMLAGAPVARRVLTNPQAAKVAHDDVENMGLLETMANSFRRGVPALEGGVGATMLRANQVQLAQFDAVAARIDAGEKPASIRAADDPMGVAYMTPEQRARFRESISTPLAGNIGTVVRTAAERQAIAQPEVVQQVLAAKTFGAAFDAFLTAPVQFIASIGPESLVTSAPGLLAAIPAGIAAGPAGAVAALGAGSFATDYGSSIVDGLTKEGVDVTNPAALQAAVKDGVLMQRVAAQAFTHASVVGAVDAASGGAARLLALPGAVATRLATRPLAREVANVGVQVPVQGAMGGIGELGGQVASGQEIEPGNILAEIVGEAFTAPAEIASVAGKRIVERVQDGRRAEAAAARIEEAIKLAEASKLRERDPATFKAFIESVSQDGATPTEFYIHAQTLANTLNQSGVTMAELEALAPALATQMRPENFVPGADLRIPVAELLAAPADISAALVDHLRDGPEAMSRAEAKAYIDAKGEEIRAEVEAELARVTDRDAYQAEVDQVRDQFQAELDAAGKFIPEVNAAYATLLGNFYAAQAERAGVTPRELMERYRLRVRAETPQRTGGRAQELEQSAATDAAGASWRASLAKLRPDRLDADAMLPVPQVLREMGVTGKALSLPQRVLMQIMQKHPDVPVDVIERLPELMSDPLFIYPHADGGINVVVDPTVGDGDAIVVGVRDGRIRTITPRHGEGRMPSAMRQALDRKSVKVYARNAEALTVARASGETSEETAKDRIHDTSEGAAPAIIAMHRSSRFAANVTYRGQLVKRHGSEVYQGARGTLSFGDDITAIPTVLALLEGADFSTFLHESGHFFLEVQADLAARVQGAIAAGEPVTDGERQIVADMDAVLKSFGIVGTPDQSALTTWQAMTLEEKREHHETFARSFEAYAMSGRSPNLALAEVFQRFRAWLVSIYRTLAGLNVKLDADVRAVFDRMLATDQAIADAQAARAMGPLFETPEQAGMTPEEFGAYQALGLRATDEATQELDARLLKDMKWLSRARDKAMKTRQREAAALRLEVRKEVGREVLSRPVYRAWSFLTGKLHDRIEGDTPQRQARTLDPERDNLFQAIAKIGGLNRTQVESQWGKQEGAESGIVGMPLLRKEGLSIDAMAERLVEAGYLLPDEDGKADLRQLEEMFDDQARGRDRYSMRREFFPEDDGTVKPIEGVEFLAGRLNTEEMKRRYGDAPEAIWRVLSARRMTNATGLDPDVVAETFGYGSGDAMVRELVDAQPPGKVIDALTDQRMLERYGDIASPAELQRAADEAVHNEMRARVIAAELKALAKATTRRESSDSLYTGGTVDVMARAAMDYARQVVGRLKLKDLRPKQYAAAEARSAKLAQQSLGNTAEAAMHKRNQLVNNYAAKAAFDAQAEITAANEFFKKVLTRSIKSISETRDVGTVQAARAILAEYGIGTKGEPAAKYLETLAANDPGMYEILRDRIDALTAAAKPVKEMTVDEFRALTDEIKGLWHMAKRTRQVEIDGKMLDIATVKLQLVEKLQERPTPDDAPGARHAVTDADRRLTKLQTVRAALRRVESWAQARDGSGGIGPFRRFIWQPVKEAADAYRADKAKYIKAYRDLLGSLDLGKQRIDAPELGYTFGHSRGGSGKAEILHAILHTGNESNKRKLLLGRGWATANEETGVLDTGKWDRFVQRMIDTGVLTKADFDFAQGVWDLLEGTKAKAQAAHRDVFGRYFDEVTANEFANQFGTYRGGYVPAMADSEVVKDAATRKLVEAEQQNLAYAFPSTAKGFTKARVEYNKPLLLDLRSLVGHIDKVLLFSHLERPVRDVRKVLASKEVSELLHRQDPTAFDGMLTPWLNRAARQVVETPVPGDSGLLRLFSKMRQRAGMAAMFANVSNAAQQITGFSLALLKVRPRHLMSATAQYLIAPRQTARTVAEASRYMATRMQNEVAIMTDAIDEVLLNPNLYQQAQQWAAKHSYFLQAAVDNVMGPIIWTGAYNQALEEGNSELDARRLADSAIRETQGSALPEDVSRIETGNTFVRMFTQFAGYFNMQANLLGTGFSNMMHELGLRRGMGRGLYIFTFGFLAPALVAELIAQAFKGGPDDDDKDGEIIDDWLMAVGVRAPIKGVFAFVPGLGQVLTAGMNAANDKPYDDRISVSPAVSMIESGLTGNVKTVKQLLAGDEVNARRAVRDLATLISMTTGLPATAVARPLGYTMGVQQNKIAPTSAADAIRGAVSGTPSPESKQ